jgi:hypothetical protein
MKWFLAVLLALTLTPSRSSAAEQRQLTLNDVMHWVDVYSETLGHTGAEVIAMLGEPSKEMPNNDHAFEWSASTKTQQRELRIVFDRDGKALFVRVWPTASEHMSVLDVLQRAELFDFESGTASNSSLAWFMAVTKNKHIQIKFIVGPSRDPVLESVTFNSPQMAKALSEK